VDDFLEQSKQIPLLQAAVDQAFNAIVITDADLDTGPRIVYVNSAFENQTGYSANELLGATPRILQGPDTDRVLLSELRRSLSSGGRFEGRTTNYRKDGIPYQVHWIISPVRESSDGPVTHYVSVQQDVTEIEEERQHRRLMATALENSSDVVMITDAQRRIIYVNGGFEKQSGYDREEVLGQTASLLQSGEHNSEFYENMWETIKAGDVFHATVIERAKDGSRFYLDETITPINDSKGNVTHYVADGQDITNHVRIERDLKRLATTDWLTELPNRRKIEDLIDQEMERSRRYCHDLSLIMFDVDWFKTVNDRYGHEAGDRVLVALAELLANFLRASDQLGRWGGEEFMILGPETDLAGARELAERIRKTVAAVEFPGVGSVTASFGVTVQRTDDSARTVTERADWALYNAKENGRNRIESL
jgi:diguanylate cyclase (GGDEF)-like protein/PAS domain S-box-containing protein